MILKTLRKYSKQKKAKKIKANYLAAVKMREKKEQLLKQFEEIYMTYGQHQDKIPGR